MPYSRLLPLLFGRRTTFFVGAGLSFDEPTGIEGARILAQQILSRYQAVRALQEYFQPAAVRSQFQGAELAVEMANRFYAGSNPRLEAIAEWFQRADGDLRRFIDGIDNKMWKLRAPNSGHFVLSKLMLEGFVDCLITTNLDERLEFAYHQIAEEHRDHWLGVVSSLPKVTSEAACKLFIYKIHGCFDDKKYETIWASSQLASATWMRGYEWARNIVAEKIQAKSVVFIGFGTDVAYINTTIESLALDSQKTEFFFICPGDFQGLQESAPVLTKALSLGATHHISARGTEFAEKMAKDLYHQCLSDILDTGNSVLFKQGIFDNGNGKPSQTKVPIEEFTRAIAQIRETLRTVHSPDQFQEFVRGALSRWLPEQIKYHSFRLNRTAISELLHAMALLSLKFEANLLGQRLPNLRIRDKFNPAISYDVLLITGQNQKSFKLLQSDVIAQWQKLAPGTRVILWNATMPAQRLPPNELVTDITQTAGAADITSGAHPVDLKFLSDLDVFAAIQDKNLAESAASIGGLMS